MAALSQPGRHTHREVLTHHVRSGFMERSVCRGCCCVPISLHHSRVEKAVGIIKKIYTSYSTQSYTVTTNPLVMKKEKAFVCTKKKTKVRQIRPTILNCVTGWKAEVRGALQLPVRSLDKYLGPFLECTVTATTRVPVRKTSFKPSAFTGFTGFSRL